MNKRIFALVATTFAILPLGVNAAQNKLQNNSSQILPVASEEVAQNHVSRGQKRGRGNRMEKLLEELDLTAEQSAEISNIREKSQTENEALYEEIRANREQISSLFANNVDVQQLRQQHQNMQSLRQQLSTNRFETILEIREVLTPEQRTKAAEIMTQHGGRRGKDRVN